MSMRSSAPDVVARHTTPRGELVLRRAGAHYEIISNGVFLMDTRDGRSERLLVAAALEGRRSARVLIGGLGVGYSLTEALRHDAVHQVTVVEIEPAVIEWHATHLAAVSGHVLDDPRVTVACADLPAWLASAGDRFDVIAVDVDNGPGWTVTPDNASLYDDAGLAALARRLTPGGALSVWSAAASPAFARRLRRHFGEVDVHTVNVARGEPDHVYVAR